MPRDPEWTTPTFSRASKRASTAPHNEQTARALGVPLGTVKAMLHRARRRLVELAEERG